MIGIIAILLSILGTVVLGQANNKVAEMLNNPLVSMLLPKDALKDFHITASFLRDYLNAGDVAVSADGLAGKLFSNRTLLAKLDEKIKAQAGGELAVHIAAYTDYLQIGGALSTLFGIAFLVGARRRRFA